MDVRCQNCGERLVATVKPTDTTLEVVCHSCGVTMRVRAPQSVAAPEPPMGEEDDPRPSEQTWKRIFEPLPKSLIYLVGGVVALAILSPMLTYLYQQQYQRNPVFLSDDTSDVKASPLGESNVAAPMLVMRDTPPTMLDQYRNLRMEAGREDVERRFNMRLRNTRGMEPEIYEATKGNDFERLTAHFYGGFLKEAFLIGREQRATADNVQRDLVEQFGQPVETGETGGPLRSMTGLNGDDLAGRLDNFAFHRSLTWTDAQYRVEAMIHFSSDDAAQCRSMLALHMTAAAWMRRYRPTDNLTPVRPPLPPSALESLPKMRPLAPAPEPAPVVVPAAAPTPAPAPMPSFMPILITNQAAPSAPIR